MTSEKIKRLVELLVERKVQKLIPILKNQIISELKVQSNKKPIKETPEKSFLKKVRTNERNPSTKVYSTNPMLNELISSARPPVEQFDPEDVRMQLFNKPQKKQQDKPLSVQQMVSTFSDNPEAKVNLQSEAVQQTLNIMNRDYSGFVKKEKAGISQQTRTIINPNQQEEDLSWLNDIG